LKLFGTERKIRARARCTTVLALLWLVLFSGCTEPAFSGNAIKSIDPDQLDRIVGAETFSGLMVAMTSWCPPCKKELPVLAELYSRYQPQGLQIIAISLDADGPSVVQPLIDKLKLPFPVYWVGQDAMTRYRIVGVPTTMVYKNGRLIEQRPGQMDRRDFEKRLDALKR